MSINISDVLIIGSGPAGYTASIYTSRANLKTNLVSGEQIGGQMTITTDVENFPGFEKPIQGPWLMEQMEKQTVNVGTKIFTDKITEIEKQGDVFVCKSQNGDVFQSKAIVIASGAQAKWLGLDSESKFRGHGVSGCATCDGFFFKNKEVAVIGGGNTAVEEALYLTKHASKVHLIHRKDVLRAEKIMQDRLFANEKIVLKWNFEVSEFIGNESPVKYLTGLKLKSTNGENDEVLNVDGAFVAIGHKPNTDFCNNLIKCDEEGYIIVKPGTTETNIAGIFSAGDVMDKKYKQAITAAGTGCMAALEVQHFLSSK